MHFKLLSRSKEGCMSDERGLLSESIALSGLVRTRTQYPHF